MDSSFQLSGREGCRGAVRGQHSLQLTVGRRRQDSSSARGCAPSYTRSPVTLGRKQVPG